MPTMTSPFAALSLCLACALLPACGQGVKQDRTFFTSGSREADQRAEQRIAKSDQLQGKKEGDPLSPEHKSLYERLGGEKGVQAIVDDFISRALADPRVNWERKNLPRGGFLHLGKKPTPWTPDPGKIQAMKLHIAQFIAVATGGPSRYQGREMQEAHRGMRIDNSQFDAAIGDLKATLDRQRIPIDDQKELLAIIESTRPQIVEVR
jgi:hemoglobin